MILNIICLFPFFFHTFECQKQPFPQAINFKNCFKPEFDQSVLNDDVKRFYDFWKSKYLKKSKINNKRYFVYADSVESKNGCSLSDLSDETANSKCIITTSEATGFGLIIIALMAGYDTNAKIYFDGLYNMFDNHRSVINSNLMQHQIALNEMPVDIVSFTGGDMDIAYALLLAHYQWGSTDEFPYLQIARNMIYNGLETSYITTALRLALDNDQSSVYTTRSSDWMFSHMRAFHEHTNDDIWSKLSSNLYTIYKIFIISYSSSTGFISDYIVDEIARAANEDEVEAVGKNQGNYYKYACRIPLRLVMDYCHYENRNGREIIKKMVKWIRNSTNENPANIKPGYNLNGESVNSDTNETVLSTLFISPILAASVTSKENQQYLTKGWEIVSRIDNNQTCIDDSYTLLSMLFISGNWWIPRESKLGDREDKVNHSLSFPAVVALLSVSLFSLILVLVVLILKFFIIKTK